jgi:hypothetical protein
MASITAHPQKAVLQAPAPQVFREFLLHVFRQWPVLRRYSLQPSAASDHGWATRIGVIAPMRYPWPLIRFS